MRSLLKKYNKTNSYTIIKRNVSRNINKDLSFYFDSVIIYFDNIILYFNKTILYFNNRKYLILIIINYYSEVKIFEYIDIDIKNSIKIEINQIIQIIKKFLKTFE